MNIVVAQYYTKNILYGRYSEKINSEYCKKNGYVYFLETDEEKIRTKSGDRSLHWYKPHLIKDALSAHPNCDYVLFLDMDAVFSNHDRRIEEFVMDNTSILMTQDYGNCITNTGVILFKNNDYTKDFLNIWWEHSNLFPEYKNMLWWDQSVIEPIYKNLEDKEQFKIIPYDDFNSRYLDNKKFIFHAFSFGSTPNRTLDNAYYEILNIERPNYKTLLEMAPMYGSDKHHTHHYFELIYDSLLSPLKYDIKTFMEVGVYNGDSLMLWRDFFENSKIIGVEKYLENSLKAIGDKNLDRIEFLKYDCSVEDELIELSKKYTDVDVIIDDASHVMLDQQLTLSILFKMLKPGGIYILEDLHTSYEASNPDKAMWGWGDPNKTITLDMLYDFKKTGKIKSDYMSEENMKYLEDNIQSLDIYQSRPDWSITSIIIKK
jgi:hypothetical protein